MKKRIFKPLPAMILIGLMLPGLLFAGTYEKKADNFIILLDLSGSMGRKYLDSEMTKLQAAKNALKELNADIADLEYLAGVYTFTPFKPLQSIAPYNKASIDRAIDAMPDDHAWNGLFSKASPLGSGIKQLDEILEGLAGKTVVYLVSDGQNTDGLFPQMEAANLQAKYDVCFSIISLADTDARKGQLGKIADVGACSKIFSVAESRDSMKLASAELYSETGAEEVAQEGIAPAIGPAEGYSPPDSDNDGINDELDKCPDTPSGLAVDAGGCRIPENIAAREVPFKINKGNLSEESQAALDEIGNYLTSHPEMSVAISGHTCNLGSEAYNMALSEKRASTVYGYLVQNFNLSKEQISMAWYGETRPIASNATDAGRLKNRRVDVNVVNKSQSL